MNNNEIIQIASSFKIEAPAQSAKAYGGGHNNDTFLIET